MSKACDKLFALNSAHSTTISGGHKVFLLDYEADETAILSRYATKFVNAGQALDLLYRARSNKGSHVRSWVPDLMNQRSKKFYAPAISTWGAAGAETETETETETAHGFSAGVRLSHDARVLIRRGGASDVASFVYGTCDWL